MKVKDISKFIGMVLFALSPFIIGFVFCRLMTDTKEDAEFALVLLSIYAFGLAMGLGNEWWGKHPTARENEYYNAKKKIDALENKDEPNDN